MLKWLNVKKGGYDVHMKKRRTVDCPGHEIKRNIFHLRKNYTNTREYLPEMLLTLVPLFHE